MYAKPATDEDKVFTFLFIGLYLKIMFDIFCAVYICNVYWDYICYVYWDYKIDMTCIVFSLKKIECVFSHVRWWRRLRFTVINHLLGI